MNVSEQIRVHAQVDVLDNLVLGSTPGTLFQQADPTPIPFGSRTQLPPSAGTNADLDSIRVKRAWAEVQTPVGLLAFGRQRAEWGLGIWEHGGGGLDDDMGDSVDRIQFAIPLRSTPIGPLTVIPYYDLIATGVATNDELREGLGEDQPIDREQADDATALGFKIVRAETAEERQLKLDQGLSLWSWGVYYSYRSQGYSFPFYDSGGTTGGPATPDAPYGASVRRDASAHVVDVWGRWESKKLRVEWEGIGTVGEIANAAAGALQPVAGPVLIRQFGGTLQTSYAATSAMRLGGEFGIASGDRAPGFGNRPGRGTPSPGDIDGAQYGAGDGDFRNFRFNPAYRVDQVLWREILGAVTDAWYLKPSLRYEILDGLSASVAVIYSQAIYRESTPSRSNRSLGVEGDFGLRYESDDGFVAWVDWGVLQPLDAWNGAGDLSRAHALRSGLAVKF
jgi:uncharacterized protein (TIGR04551 family)